MRFRLPDFAKSVDFRRLRIAMGISEIPEVPPVQFIRQVRRTRIVEEVSEEDRALDRRLRSGETIPISRGEFDGGTRILSLRGRKVAAYIRDQRQGIDWRNRTSTYRYHLVDCVTLQSMRADGRERRYLATQRSDGMFEVRWTPGWQSREMRADLRLDLCQNCRQELHSLGHWFAPFTLADYFARFDSRVPRTVRREEEVEETQKYQPNQAEIAREYKQAVGHRCQICGVDCTGVAEVLHLHHVNGDTSDNEHGNLRVLCIDCHANQPRHAQLGRNARAKDNIRQVQSLRRQQGIFGGSALSGPSEPG